MIGALIVLWCTWCALNLLLMALARPRVPAYTGFRIVMPEYLKQQLTISEYRAVLTHEHGHRYHLHIWRNYVRVCVFWFPSKTHLLAQELQADDYAISQGCGIALSTALRKLSRSPMDWVRAKRLEEQDWVVYLCKGYPTEKGEA